MFVATCEASLVFRELVGFTSDFVGSLEFFDSELNSSIGSGVEMIEDSSCTVVSSFKFGLGLEFEVDPENDPVCNDEFVDTAANLNKVR